MRLMTSPTSTGPVQGLNVHHACVLCLLLLLLLRSCLEAVFAVVGLLVLLPTTFCVALVGCLHSLPGFHNSCYCNNYTHVYHICCVVYHAYHLCCAVHYVCQIQCVVYYTNSV